MGAGIDRGAVQVWVLVQVWVQVLGCTPSWHVSRTCCCAWPKGGAQQACDERIQSSADRRHGVAHLSTDPLGVPDTG